MTIELLSTIHPQENCIEILPFGSKLKIFYWSKATGQRKKARIIQDPHSTPCKIYHAQFQEDDIDFEIFIDNFPVSNRSVQVEFSMGSSSKPIGYMVYPRSIFVLQALESFGRKFHFIVQPTAVKTLLEKSTSPLCTKIGENINYNSLIPGQIKFQVSYSTKIGQDGQVEVVRTSVSNKHFWEYAREKSISECVIEDKEEEEDINWNCDANKFEEENLISNQNEDKEEEEVSENSKPPNGKEGRGEKGSICFGRSCSQDIPEGLQFDRDLSISVEPFIVEMRLVESKKKR